MAPWWNSVESVGRINTVVLACAAVLGLLAAAFVVASWFTGTRLAGLQDVELSRYKTDADLRISESNRGAAQANERASRLEKESADLTQKNLALEAAIAPRRLSEKQSRTLAALTGFSNPVVEIRSYANDTEGLVLATQVFDALSKSKIPIQDNRLTMQPAGSVSFGILVDGPDKALVEELKKVLSSAPDLIKGSGESPIANRGVTTQVLFGRVGGARLSATITVGVKPIR